MHKTLTALALLAALAPAHAADSWTSADKGLHAAAGALIYGGTLQLAGDARLALAAGTAAAIGKELFDMGRRGHVASYRDAAVTMAGTLLATQTPGLIITPLSVSYRTTW